MQRLCICLSLNFALLEFGTSTTFHDLDFTQCMGQTPSEQLCFKSGGEAFLNPRRTLIFALAFALLEFVVQFGTYICLKLQIQLYLMSLGLLAKVQNKHCKTNSSSFQLSNS